MKPIHNHKMLMVLGIIITFFVILLYAYLQYSINNSIRTVSSMNVKISSVEQGKQYDEQLLNTYTSSSSDWQRLQSFFIPSDEVVAFIESLEKLGPETGGIVKLSSIDADQMDGKNPGSIGKIHAHVDSGGSWSSVMRILTLAEVLPYNVSINKVVFNTSGESGAQKWHLMFDISADQLVRI